MGQCRGWDMETDLLSQWRERPDLFLHIPERSRFNRWRRNLMHAINCIRQLVVQLLDVAYGRYCTIDSLPVPVVQFHLVPGASQEWAAYDATFGAPVARTTCTSVSQHNCGSLRSRPTLTAQPAAPLHSPPH